MKPKTAYEKMRWNREKAAYLKLLQPPTERISDGDAHIRWLKQFFKLERKPR